MKNGLKRRIRIVLPSALVALVIFGGDIPRRAETSTGIDRAQGTPPSSVHTSSQFATENWGSADGLQQNSLMAIAQSPDGFLWVGTQEGVARFDGVKFTTFKNPDQWLNQDPWVQAMIAAGDGSIWIGTKSGLNRIKDGQFTHFTGQSYPNPIPAPALAQAVLPDHDVQALAEDESGAIWIGTRNGLARYHGNTFQIWTTRDGLPSNFVSQLLPAKDGSLWIGTGNGLSQFKGGRVANSPVENALAGNQISELYEDNGGALWIGTQTGGLHRAAGRGGGLGDEKTLTAFTMNEGLPSNNITGIAEDGDGRPWIATDEGLSYLERGRLIAFPLSGQAPHTLYADRTGDIWVGTSTKGLMQIRKSKFAVIGSNEGLSNDVIASVLEARDGSLWVGTDRGLNRIRDGKIESWTRKDGLPHNAIISLSEMRDGGLWVGTMAGLCSFSDGRFRCHTSKDGLPDSRVFAAAEEKNGTSWFGAYTGLARYRDGKFDAPWNHTALGGSFINDLLVTNGDGSLWVTTTRNGLFHLKDGALRQYTVADGLPTNLLNSVTEDRAGAIWIGTEKGLTRFEGGGFTTYSDRQGLPRNQVFAVIEDDADYLWLSSNHGLVRIAKTQFQALDQHRISRLSAYQYGQGDGMRSEECNANTQPIAWKTRDGRLLFPTINGLVSIAPAELAPSSGPPPVFIERLLADQEPLFPGADLEIGPDVRHLEIGFTALNYLEPKQLRFKYKLDGVDGDWVEAGSRRFTVYNRLTPGQYNFRVIAGNAEGRWNETGATLRFRIKPFFYQTWWFFGLCLLTAAAAVYAIHRARLTHANERLLQKIAMSLPTAMAVTDERDSVTMLNQQFVHDFGYGAGDIRSLDDWFRSAYPDPREREAARAEWRNTAASGAGPHPNQHESSVTCKDGRVRDVEFRFARIHNRQVVTLNDITERKNAEAHLRELASRLQTIREEEREFISREIHDELGQLLTGLKLEVNWVGNKLPPDSLHLRQKIETILELINDTIKAVRNIATEFRPSILDSFGLMEAIEWQVEDFEKRSGIRCEVIETTDTSKIDRDRATAVFRILQESLTNVARHADATLVIVSLREEDSQLVLQVEDDGRGITPGEIAGSRSLGLLGMRERVRHFNGQISVVGVPGEGTTVTMSLPLEAPPAAALARAG